MKRLHVVFTAIVALALTLILAGVVGRSAPTAAVAPAVWRPRPGASWQLQLQGTIDASVDAQIFDIDLFDAPQSVIDTLHAAGRNVICYFSAGSWEDWRPDADDFPPAVLGNPLMDWPDERWLDIRRLDLLQPIMNARLDLAVQKGCDGVDPDNVDGYANATGFPLSAEDQLAYNRWLARAAHERGLSVGLKNDLDQIPDLIYEFDWALNEECFFYDECAALKPFVQMGKAVFGVEYQGDPDSFCPQANALGFDWLQKNLDLDAWRLACREAYSAPQPTPAPVQFAIIGDYGAGNWAEAQVAALVQSWQPDFVVTLGDNNYPNGAASTIDKNIGRDYHAFIYPYVGGYGAGADLNRFFPALGNHDWRSISCDSNGCSGPYFDYFQLPGNERYYDLMWGPVQLFVLDSDHHEPDGRSPGSRQGQWLQTRLAEATAPWRLVFFHHPPYSSAAHGSQTAMQWPFADWGAQAVFGGHDHTYERIERDGILYFVNGIGGASPYQFGDAVAGSQVRYNETYGAMRVLADANQITFEFINIQGEVIDRVMRTAATPTPTATATPTPTPTATPRPTKTPTPMRLHLPLLRKMMTLEPEAAGQVWGR